MPRERHERCDVSRKRTTLCTLATKERERNSRRKKKKEATLSQIMEEGLCYSRSRGCKSFAIYGILSEKRLDKRPIKSLPAKSRPKSSTNPFPPPSGLFSSSMNRGGISNNARWKPTLPRVHSCGRSKMRRLSIKPWPSNNGRKEKIYYLRFGIFPA